MIRKTFRGFEAKAPAMIKDEKSFNPFLKRNFGASGSVSERRTETRSRRSFEARNSGDKSDKVLKLILSKFNEFYDELYDADDVEWRDEMLDLFDDYIIKECNPLIGALVNARHDVFSSDRECAAIAKTLVHFGLWPEGYPKK